jgi:hypothetical protein
MPPVLGMVNASETLKRLPVHLSECGQRGCSHCPWTRGCGCENGCRRYLGNRLSNLLRAAPWVPQNAMALCRQGRVHQCNSVSERSENELPHFARE